MSSEQAAELLVKVEQWDLEKVKRRLEEDPEFKSGYDHFRGNNIYPTTILGIDYVYRRFMVLKGLYADEIITPPREVDKFWHYHILDTMAYAADCEATFGRFIHHIPDDPNKPLDYASKHECYIRMYQLYVENFDTLEPHLSEEYLKRLTEVRNGKNFIENDTPIDFREIGSWIRRGYQPLELPRSNNTATKGSRLRNDRVDNLGDLSSCR